MDWLWRPNPQHSFLAGPRFARQAVDALSWVKQWVYAEGELRLIRVERERRDDASETRPRSWSLHESTDAMHGARAAHWLHSLLAFSTPDEADVASHRSSLRIRKLAVHQGFEGVTNSKKRKTSSKKTPFLRSIWGSHLISYILPIRYHDYYVMQRRISPLSGMSVWKNETDVVELDLIKSSEAKNSDVRCRYCCKRNLVNREKIVKALLLII